MPSLDDDDEPPQRARIRQARLADLSQVAALEESSFETDRFSPRTLRGLATRASSLMLVAVSGKRILGYAAVLFRSGSASARVYGLCVAQAARGQGVARALMAGAQSHAGRRGAQAIRLEVRQDNVAARGLYASLGFVPCAQLPAYYADGADGVRLKKFLKPRKGQG